MQSLTTRASPFRASALAPSVCLARTRWPDLIVMVNIGIASPPNCHRASFCLAAERDPAFIEAIEHAHARRRVAYSLVAENLFPALTPHNLDADGTLQRRGKSLCQIVR